MKTRRKKLLFNDNSLIDSGSETYLGSETAGNKVIKQSQFSSQLSTTNSKVANLESDMDTAKSDIVSNRKNISGNSSAIIQHNERLSGHENTLFRHGNTLDGHTRTIQEHGDKINTLATEVGHTGSSTEDKHYVKFINAPPQYLTDEIDLVVKGLTSESMAGFEYGLYCIGIMGMTDFVFVNNAEAFEEYGLEAFDSLTLSDWREADSWSLPAIFTDQGQNLYIPITSNGQLNQSIIPGNILPNLIADISEHGTNWTHSGVGWGSGQYDLMEFEKEYYEPIHQKWSTGLYSNLDDLEFDQKATYYGLSIRGLPPAGEIFTSRTYRWGLSDQLVKIGADRGIYGFIPDPYGLGGEITLADLRYTLIELSDEEANAALDDPDHCPRAAILDLGLNQSCSYYLYPDEVMVAEGLSAFFSVKEIVGEASYPPSYYTLSDEGLLGRKFNSPGVRVMCPSNGTIGGGEVLKKLETFSFLLDNENIPYDHWVTLIGFDNGRTIDLFRSANLYPINGKDQSYSVSGIFICMDKKFGEALLVLPNSIEEAGGSLLAYEYVPVVGHTTFYLPSGRITYTRSGSRILEYLQVFEKNPVIDKPSLLPIYRHHIKLYGESYEVFLTFDCSKPDQFTTAREISDYIGLDSDTISPGRRSLPLRTPAIIRGDAQGSLHLAVSVTFIPYVDLNNGSIASSLKNNVFFNCLTIDTGSILSMEQVENTVAVSDTVEKLNTGCLTTYRGQEI